MLPRTLRREDGLYILQRVLDGDCSAVVGVSNTGKSQLLRTLESAEARHELLGEQVTDLIFVYVDFNLMLEATEQGLYEVDPAMLDGTTDPARSRGQIHGPPAGGLRDIGPPSQRVSDLPQL